ncbi:MAG TPA: peptidylprolyl isomerase [Vicinamibacteria bacterium]|nr:peptidylprolyl isomerase [Vicinamibacteria bacterium]
MTLAAALAVLLAQAPAAPAATPTPAPPPAGPVVSLVTSLGEIRIALRPDKAPLTVDNFLKYVKSGHYPGTIFHRVIPGFMVQGGGMDAKLNEKPTRPPVRNEAKNGLRNRRGTVAMARTNDPHSAAAQFFVNVKDNHSLDFGIRGAGYTVFGEVIEGMEVVDRIVAVPTHTSGGHPNVPDTPVVIKSARVVSAGVARPTTKS